MPEGKPVTLRRTGIEITIGVVLGFLLATLIGPRLIKVLYEPPSKDAFSCAGSVEKALGQFVVLQLAVAAAGGLTLALVLFLFRRMLNKRKANAVTPS
jgi:hypothetical protein